MRHGTILELFTIAFLNANHMKGSLIAVGTMAALKLFKAAGISEKPHRNANILNSTFGGVNHSNFQQRKGSLII